MRTANTGDIDPHFIISCIYKSSYMPM